MMIKENKKLNLKVPGKHNISNAMAVLVVARELKILDKTTFKVLSEFSGTWRRMEFRGEINNAKIYDDYGHHPTEIKATLQGARSLLFERAKQVENSIDDFSTSSKNKKGCLWLVFQPHQYQRTYKLFDQFISAFDNADKIIILPIYSVPGREKESIKKKVNSEMLVKAIIKNYERTSSSQVRVRITNHEIKYAASFAAARNYLRKNLRKNDVAIIMGAGDVNKLTEMLLE